MWRDFRPAKAASRKIGTDVRADYARDEHDCRRHAEEWRAEQQQGETCKANISQADQ